MRARMPVDSSVGGVVIALIVKDMLCGLKGLPGKCGHISDVSCSIGDGIATLGVAIC